MNEIKENNFFIPRKIAVGFVNRINTYSGRLSYITYYDNTNKLRKETSWNNWRDEKIDPVYTDNVPTSGFILNKRAGGEKWGWNQRQTYARIYDPRGFEFEITIDNLLWILEYVNAENKELKGQFVYSWYGTDLVLMPVVSSDYEESKRLSEQRYSKKSFKESDLIPGTLYKMKGKDMNEFVYIGKVKVSQEFNKSYVNKLAFVSISHDNWIFRYNSWDDKTNNLDYFIFKSSSSVIAEMQQNYFSEEQVKEYLHRFDMCAYSYNFWNNFGDFINKFVPDHPSIMNDYKKPCKICYEHRTPYPENKLIETFTYEGTQLDKLKLLPDWMSNSYDARDIKSKNMYTLKSVISNDGKSVLIKDFYPILEDGRMIYGNMYDFVKIDLNTNTYEKICDPGNYEYETNFNGYTRFETIIFPHESSKGEREKANLTKKHVELNDDRNLLYYITKDNYISSSLQELISGYQKRIMLFGFTDGVKENKWNINNYIRLPRKIK